MKNLIACFSVKGKKTKMNLVLLLVAIPLMIFSQNIDENIKSKQQVYSENITGTQQMSPDELKNRMDSKKEFILIDVGTQREHDAGYISGSVWIPRGFIELKIQEVCKNPETVIVVYCSLGRRSILAVKSLQKLGYKNIFNLEGGTNAWIKKEYSLYNPYGEIKILNFGKKDPDLSTYDIFK